MDIEDAYKLKILTTEETKELLMAYFSEERQEHLRKTFLIVNDVNEQIAYLRSSVIGLLIRECTRVFLDHEQEILSGTFEGSLIKRIAERPAAAYKHSVEVSINKIYRSRDVLDVELAGFPHHQYPARIDDRCRNLTRKDLFQTPDRPGFQSIQYKSARTL